MNLKNNQHQYVISVLNRSAADCPEVLVGYSENLYRAKLVETVLSSLEKKDYSCRRAFGVGKNNHREKTCFRAVESRQKGGGNIYGRFL